MTFVAVQRLGFALLVLGLASALPARGEALETGPEHLVREALVIESLGRAGRSTLFTDLLESRLAAGQPVLPRAGDTFTLPDGRVRTWSRATADTNGLFSGMPPRGGWLAFTVESDAPEVLLLKAQGHSMAYVNGEPRMGDLYRNGYVQTPVLLKPGTNQFLLAAGRGPMAVRLIRPRAEVTFNPGDPTLPDLRVGERINTACALVLVNATPRWTQDLTVAARVNGRTTRTPVPPIPPLGVRKVGIRLEGPAPRKEGTVPAEFTLESGRRNRQTPDRTRLDLRVRRPEQPYKRTFVSSLDGSVQYFAVNPCARPDPGVPQALFLSLHGASVEAIGQAESYAPKRWGHVVCPTNRRPYGFDWEDWGRWDALEVLDLATRELNPDPALIYLTGHSMGGHGTWNLGVNFPDRFAALGPSAGWISFFSYAGGDPYTNATPVEQMLRRAAASSDTLQLATNYLHHGIYIIHGDADDNVPVREARRMREELGRFHHDFAWHEQPGAGHWWETSDEPGAECIDWPPLFDFFARHRRPADDEVRQIDFVTVNPGISSRSHWIGIDSQDHPLQTSQVTAQWDPGLQRVTATTRNVRRLGIDATAFKLEEGARLKLRIDGQELEAAPAPASGRSPGRQITLKKEADRWQESAPAPASHKHPGRYGPFKEAFRHRMLFVYGTRGTPEENAWALAKARFDAEQFWYRGNGAVDIIPDTGFTLAETRDRSVILYGHRDQNAAWPLVLADSPVQVRRGEIRVGGRAFAREDLACLFLQPRPDSAVASVGVVSGSGIHGLRLTHRLPYFLSGTGFPDCLLLSPQFLQEGASGIVAAGFFGPDWSVEGGEFAWGPGASGSR